MSHSISFRPFSLNSEYMLRLSVPWDVRRLTIYMLLRIAARREGDAPSVWASTEYAEKELGWKYVALPSVSYLP